MGAENFLVRAKSADAPGADGDAARRARDRRDDFGVAVIPGHELVTRASAPAVFVNVVAAGARLVR